ncbi:hypothetical protein K504DRAFT_449010 [Pleomassaria siparia CBS 279.74]|uniref:Heterokaryon incompatibility domain-containing protein n=1 Tax=Pleomassaria siparia CBS 279.74 TaxID=1314801 RepID=A0A6G1JWE7_9PLEO|nr:hypothetical protein K504DRAFT_449010 [Pleomassaria siparia CBS 279.74]
MVAELEVKCPACRIAKHALWLSKSRALFPSSTKIHNSLRFIDPPAFTLPGKCRIASIRNANSGSEAHLYIGPIPDVSSFSVVPEKVSSACLRALASTSCDGRSRCEPDTAQRLPQNLRVIDVSKRKISTTDCSDFVALSYVWGDAPNIQGPQHREFSGQTGLSSRSPFPHFARHLERYTKRSLSHQSDVYNAFGGITSALYGVQSWNVYGLPQQDFDRALLWFTLDRKTKNLPLSGNDTILPSWSWAAAMSNFELSVGELGHMIFGALAFWFTYKSDLKHGMLQAVNVHTNTKMHAFWQVYMDAACKHGCVGNDVVLLPTWSGTTLEFVKVSRQRWPNYYTLCREAREVGSSLGECSSAEFGIDLEDIKPGVLVTMTQCAYFQLNWFEETYIVDAKGRAVGKIFGSPSCEERPSTIDESTRHEFIALSLGGKWGINTSDGEQILEFQLPHIPLTNVMLIGRRGKYAYRKKVGWILFRDWIEADLECKTILLE